MRKVLLFISLVLTVALLGCDREETPTRATSPTEATAPSDRLITIGVMPKLVPIPYFQACEKGALEAGKELAGVAKVVYDGPATDSDEKQQQMLDVWIAKRYDVLAVAPVNPESIANRLKKARERGLHVVTYDADATPESREVFVNQATYESIAHALVDIMAEGIGNAGETVIISGSRTAANQRIWMKHVYAYMKEKYPKIEVVEEFYPGEDHAEAVKAAQRAMIKYPDLKGIFGITSVSLPASAEAVRQERAADRVFVTGLATPNDMKEYIHDGTVKKFALWDAVDLGYLTVYVSYYLARGELPEEGTIAAGRLGGVTVTNGEVLLGPPVVFTKQNIDQYDF